MSPESTSPSGQALPAGTRLEEFEVERVLGTGGFGITYLARDVKLGRQVVIKENLPAQFAFRDMSSLTVSPRNTEGEDADNFAWSLENFSREASTLASLDHPGIVPVMQRFEAFGTSYFVMPYMEGLPLDELMKNRRERGEEISDDELRGLLEHVLDALGYLHSRGIYHRDIKPGNILVTKEGVPILIDFGSARQRLSERSMTVVESAGYTPFEQLESRGNVGPWSDLYALGATVSKAITGEAPPKANDRMRNDPYVWLGRRPGLQGQYSGVLLGSLDRALAVDESARWQEAGQWQQALMVAEEPVPPVAVAPPPVAVTPAPPVTVVPEPPVVAVPSSPVAPARSMVVPAPDGGWKPPTQLQGARKKKSSKGVLVAVGLVAVVAMGGVALVLTGNDGEEPEKSSLLEDEKEIVQIKVEEGLGERTKVEEETARNKAEVETEPGKNEIAVKEKEEEEQFKAFGEPGPGEQYSWDSLTVNRIGDNVMLSLAFSPSGHPAISYYDSTNEDLKYASFDGRNWTIQTIDREGNVGRYPSLAFSPSGQPAISYSDSTNRDLKYASFDGRKWTPQTIDREGKVGWYTSLAFSPSGQPAISYRDSTNGTLNYAFFDGQNWKAKIIDHTAGPYGAGALVFSPSGYPAMSYYDNSTKSLKYAWYDGRNWVIQIIDKEGDVGRNSSLVFASSGLPAISYYDSINKALKYAAYDGENWWPEIIDVEVGYPISLAFSPSDKPVISYRDRSSDSNNLWVASFDSRKWKSQLIEKGTRGSGSSLAFSPSGQLTIAYEDRLNKDLKFARRVIVKSGKTPPNSLNRVEELAIRRTPAAFRTPSPGEQYLWKVATVAKNVRVDLAGLRSSRLTSLAFSPSGKLAISYFGGSAGGLKLASYNGRKWTTQTIDNTGRAGEYPSLAFSSTSRTSMAISYYDQSNKALKYASLDAEYRKTGTVEDPFATVTTGWKWTTRFIDRGGSGTHSSLAFSPSRKPAISYYDSNNGDLKYASLDGRKWTTQTIDGAGRVGEYSSVAFSPSGQPAISYYSNRGDLKYASFDGQKWTTQTIDRGGVGMHTSLAFSPSGQPAISYHDSKNDALKYASFDGQKWTAQIIDRSPWSGMHTSLAFGPSGFPGISYCIASANRPVKYASFDGRKWETQVISSGSKARLTSPSLAFSPSGQPAVSYHDSSYPSGTNGALKYAQRVIVKKGSGALKSAPEE